MGFPFQTFREMSESRCAGSWYPDESGGLPRKKPMVSKGTGDSMGDPMASERSSLIGLQGSPVCREVERSRIQELHDLHATMLHLLGFGHERLTFRHAGHDCRLTDVFGNVVREVIAAG